MWCYLIKYKLYDKLVEECCENIDWNKMIYYVALNDHEKSNSCTIYIALLLHCFLIIINISSAFICSHWYLRRRSNTDINTNIKSQTSFY